MTLFCNLFMERPSYFNPCIPTVAITSKRYKVGCQLALITNGKSHTGFRLIPTSVTLNDLERRNIPYFAFFPPNSIALLANYLSQWLKIDL